MKKKKRVVKKKVTKKKVVKKKVEEVDPFTHVFKPNDGRVAGDFCKGYMFPDARVEIVSQIGLNPQTNTRYRSKNVVRVRFEGSKSVDMVAPEFIKKRKTPADTKAMKLAMEV